MQRPCSRLRFFPRFLAIGALVLSATAPATAFAQPPSTTDELASARQLFAAALDDEEHERYAEALEKYQRVLGVRDTASIRFRMGTSFAALGKVTSAIEAYRAAINVATKSAEDVDIARASQARIDALEPKVAHLALVPSGAPPHEVRIDGEVVPTESIGELRVDPGRHVVEATQPGKRPFRAQVTLSEGGRAELPIVFEGEASPAKETAHPPAAASSLRTAGVVTAAVGAALAIGGGVVLALRSGAIAELHESCPSGDCPRSRQQELQDTHDRAVVQGPLGGTMLAVGGAAIATGVVLYLVGRPAPTSARLAPSVQGGVGLAVTKGFW